MTCYLCGFHDFKLRKGQVRDAHNIQIVECENCSLVTLSSNDHITSDFYESSKMHGTEPTPMDVWLRDTERDDQRRFEQIKVMLPNKRLLDFGCGAGGFILRARDLAKEVIGVELENRVQSHWAGEIKIASSLEDAGKDFDLITAFHVVEHLLNPRETLINLSKHLKFEGRLIIEVPNSTDALLSLYDCGPFQRFTYWSQHIFLFNSTTLSTLARQAGLKLISIQHYQRYPLSNHLYWLSRERPGGHINWAFIDTPELHYAYSSSLAALGITDTLIVHLERMN